MEKAELEQRAIVSKNIIEKWKSVRYMVNVGLDFPNPEPTANLQKNFVFEIEHYNFTEGISRTIINEEITKKGFDVSTVIGVSYDVRCEPKKKKN